ncbi:hypothetical protein PsYK624_172750 [Phanerochaete sordida]|uniref:Uncharacterized protein n=1 Tax=Phanerochaete sordida TaxID=48140 RepID=A0A9P3GSA8_9APHY|nr:hypothetical protein PsYK624_172750 [Phanerochaete sordida]
MNPPVPAINAAGNVFPTQQSSQRGWWRDYFHDHPLASQKHAESYTNSRRRDKIKISVKSQREDVLRVARGVCRISRMLCG